MTARFSGRVPGFVKRLRQELVFQRVEPGQFIQREQSVQLCIDCVPEEFTAAGHIAIGDPLKIGIALVTRGLHLHQTDVHIGIDVHKTFRKLPHDEPGKRRGSQKSVSHLNVPAAAPDGREKEILSAPGDVGSASLPGLHKPLLLRQTDRADDGDHRNLVLPPQLFERGKTCAVHPFLIPDSTDQFPADFFAPGDSFFCLHRWTSPKVFIKI